MRFSTPTTSRWPLPLISPMALEAFFGVVALDVVTNEMALPVVLEPVERAAVGVGGGDVERAVAGQIGDGQPEGIAEALHDEMFAEVGHRFSCVKTSLALSDTRTRYRQLARKNQSAARLKQDNASSLRTYTWRSA